MKFGSGSLWLNTVSLCFPERARPWACEREVRVEGSRHRFVRHAAPGSSTDTCYFIADKRIF